MEASHILTGFETEEHSSSESGWTMYIGSSIHENDHYSYNTYKQEGYHKNQCPNDYNDEESDDSMASDASSGPSHHKFPSSRGQSLGMEKLQKQVIKRVQRRNRLGKEKLELNTISAPSRIQRGDTSKDKQLFEPGRIGVLQISQSY